MIVTVLQPSLGENQPAAESGGNGETETRNATFADMKRRWGSTCPPDQLDRLLESSAATNRATNAAAVNAPNNLMLSNETHTQQTRNPTSGRTLQDAIDVEGESESLQSEETLRLTALHTPVLISTKPTAQPAGAALQSTQDFQINVLSSFEVTAKHASTLIRRYLDLRDQCQKQEDQLRRLHKSMRHQSAKLKECERMKGAAFAQGPNNNSNDALDRSLVGCDDIDQDIQNCNRVKAQLSRQISSTQQQHANDTTSFKQTQKEAIRAYKIFQSALGRYQDPFLWSTGADKALSVNRILHRVALRQSGLSARGIGQYRFTKGNLGCALSTRGIKRDLMRTQFSHGATINTHLSYSIYCLRFDRTGRYFVTGADDYLAKVYCLGEHVYPKRKTIDRESLIRGAVLVCTLRGHAGVINDINVSADNAFLATASEDGDCRVWGLKDGTPIAILRGHVGGANMVIWSELTPYRLITAGSDGFARVWDIKEACIRRYKSLIGKRKDYKRRESNSTAVVDSEAPTEGTVARPEATNNGAEPVIPLPAIPLPPPAPSGQNANPDSVTNIAGPVNAQPNAASQQQGGLVVPPLPEDDRPALGRFVSGTSCDRGVKLLSKLQHGTTRDDGATLGTRSRRSAVKVLTVAFCPTGRHFTTGADDGICRVFSTCEDIDLEIDDHKDGEKFGIVQKVPPRSSRRNAESKPLLTLKGHLSAITDLQYSNIGDRILSASQKDGVVRVWSFAPDLDRSTTNSSIASPMGGKNPNVSHIVIQLSNPNAPIPAVNQTARRRPTRSVTNKVSCDVATWTKDDSYIVTSQCEIAKITTMEIVPGSQNIFVWDSVTGQCLMGINGCHSKQCTIVLPHPMDPSLICSAGSDGQAKLWDLETGKCLFSYQNKVEFGPLNDARDRGMISAFLDGSFSPDGTNVVLTDDAGRVTVLGCMRMQGQSAQPEWSQEQYFANDYYELSYDTHGYCIERGSEQPPHLAPQGVRCSHSGASAGEEANKAFKSLVGPLPIAEHDVRWERIKRRLKAEHAGSNNLQRALLVGQYEPGTTILLNADGKSSELAGTGTSLSQPNHTPVAAPTQDQQRSPELSRNYRWRDYSDILNEEREEDFMDSDDGSYQLENSGQTTGRRRTNNSTGGDHEDYDSDMDLDNDAIADPPGRDRDRRTGTQRRRYEDIDSSSDEGFDEYMSSNNTPSGPFVADYDASSGHFWRMSQNSQINRAWLQRVESAASYDGKKKYAPQVGDSVVYIPRAHQEIANDFPSLEQPWQNWPEEAFWPVVQCVIRNIRYRFPYRSYFGRGINKKCESIVAILTCELTGIPEPSPEGALWPRPVFVSPPGRRITFELGLFESDATDFIIPLDLYVARVSALGQDPVDLEVDVFYSKGDPGVEDDFLESFGGRIEAVEGDIPENTPGSGYQALSVQWNDQGGSTPCSTWELNVRNQSETSSRPQLSDADKRKIREALHEVNAIPNVKSTFSKPVDRQRYSDYDFMVEVPMTLQGVRTRCESNYYSNMLSAVSDVKLIRDNCAKYNGENNELTELANAMMNKFIEVVLSNEEQSEYRIFQDNLESRGGVPNNEPAEVSPSHQAQAENQTMVVRRSRRSTRSTGTLERMFDNTTTANSSSRQPRVRIRMSRGAPRDQSSTSVLEPAQPPVAALEAGARGRRTRNSRDAEVPSRSLRSRAATVPEESVLAGNGRTLRSSVRPMEDTNTNSQDSREARAARRSANAALNEVSPQNAYAPNLEDEVASVDPGSDNQDSQYEGPSRAVSDRRSSSRTRSSARFSSEAYVQGEGGQDLDADDDEERRSTTSSPRRSTRRASRGMQAGNKDKDDGSFGGSESDDSSDDDSEEEIRRQSPRTRKPQNSRKAPSRAQAKTAASEDEGSYMEESESDSAKGSEEEDEELSSEEVASTRRSQRTRQSKRSTRQRHSKHDNDPSDLDEESLDVDENLDSDNDDDEASQGTTVGRSRRRAATRDKSYHVPSSDEDFGNESDESEHASKPKRKGPKSRNKKPAKKAKSNPRALADIPEMKPWPDIDLHEITRVTKAMMERLNERDHLGAFALPVVEAYPEFAENYQEKITSPMDFRTIEEDRLMSYQSIRDLQEDLKLVFHNCIIFNAKKSGLNKHATEMLNELESTFTSVCNDLNILLPRRWRI